MAIFGPVSRYARGLFGLLDLKSDGIGPSGFTETIAPVVNMGPFLGTDAMRIVEADFAIPGPLADLVTEFRPPVGTTWLVRSIAAWTFFGGGADRASVQVGIVAPVGSTGAGPVRIPLATSGYTTLGNAAHVLSPLLVSVTLPELVVISGSGPVVAVGLPGLFAAVQTGSVFSPALCSVRALVHEVPS